jgi:hypothetical protein
MADSDNRHLRKQKKAKMGKENKIAMRDLVESGAVMDMGWDEKEVWR